MQEDDIDDKIMKAEEPLSWYILTTNVNKSLLEYQKNIYSRSYASWRDTWLIIDRL
jgi:hypothetical protein